MIKCNKQVISKKVVINKVNYNIKLLSSISLNSAEPKNRNKKFLKEPSIDSNVLKKSNLIPLPPIKPKSNGKQEKKVVNSGRLL